ncbi:hypothetical protein P5673_018956 [Acropora cervicornis]|uniref:Uncharacterized protein n=1 Tax=Acropora cervicornis TaxID=6130 RepID=A0AAD9QCA2_ACRCE|nr:hypothetical protein P5673_018956 [Acropora cervicornis]
MKRNRCSYPATDNDLKSPNPKDSRPTEAKPAQANPCVRRNLTRDFKNPSEDQSSGEDLHVALKDLGADDNGAWEISCPKQRFQIFREDGSIKSSHYTKDYSEGTITLRRQYAHHKATEKEKNVTFTRVISSAFGEKGVAFPFTRKETEICMAPHGNRKSNTTNHYQTQPTTLEALKVAVNKQGAKRECDSVFQEAGGSLHSRSTSKDPRNQQEARSLKHRKRLTTDFKTSMIESVRRAAQVEDGFTINASESLNEELKS